MRPHHKTRRLHTHSVSWKFCDDLTSSVADLTLAVRSRVADTMASFLTELCACEKV